MSQGLSVSRLINVSVNLAPLAAQFANVDSLLIVGDSDVIDTTQRLRSYNTLAAVVADFGTSAPEYLAAQLFFSQLPQPTQLYVGRWAQAATKGRLYGGLVSAANQLPGAWTGIVSGGINFLVDGVARNLAGLNFSAVTNMNGVAAIINTALGVNGTCTWDSVNQRLVVKSATTGAASSVAFATVGAGTDISVLTKLNAAGGGNVVNGIVSETAVQAVAALDQLATTWYGLMFASTNIVDADHLAIAAYIEGTFHMYGVSTIAAGAVNSSVTNDIGSLLAAQNYKRTLTHYSSSNPYAVASLFGREFTVDYQGNNTVINLMYKQEPGITAENITASQADTLIAKRYNFFVQYNNNTAILQNGVMAGPYFIDEVHGTDAWANELQTNIYNLLYTNPTKVPQTDAGIHQIVTVAEATCASFVNNGLLAPGTWQTGGFGTLKQNDFLDKGYYVYAPPIALQAPADRAARKCPPLQIAGKLAGAVDSVNIIINVNR